MADKHTYYVEVVHFNLTSTYTYITCRKEDLDNEVAKIDKYYIDYNIHQVL